MPKNADPLCRRSEIAADHVAGSRSGAERRHSRVGAKIRGTRCRQPAVLSPSLPVRDVSRLFSGRHALLAVAGYHEVLLHKADGSGVVARLVGRRRSASSRSSSRRTASCLAATGGVPAHDRARCRSGDVGKRKLKALRAGDVRQRSTASSWSRDGSKLVAFGCADNSRASDRREERQGGSLPGSPQ